MDYLTPRDIKKQFAAPLLKLYRRLKASIEQYEKTLAVSETTDKEVPIPTATPLRSVGTLKDFVHKLEGRIDGICEGRFKDRAKDRDRETKRYQKKIASSPDKTVKKKITKKNAEL